MINNEMDLEKKENRKPLIAFLFSCVYPGLGQLYNGQLHKAVSIYIIELLLILTLFYYGIRSTFVGFVIGITMVIIFHIVVIIDSVIVSNKLNNYKLKQFNKWYFYVLFLLCIYLLNSQVFTYFESYSKNYKIPNSAMENSLLIGDHIISDQKYFDKHSVNRFDIIIYEYKNKQGNEVKRVIGLPGEKIEIINKEVFINDKSISSVFIKHIDNRILKKDQGNLTIDNNLMVSRDNFGPYYIPQNSYFVLGDNRDLSADSRYSGVVNQSEIIGKPLYIYFSLGSEPLINFREYIINKNSKKVNHIRWDRIGKEIE